MNTGEPSMGTDPPLSVLVDRTRGLQPWRKLFHAASGLTVAGLLLFLVPFRSLAPAILGGLFVLLLGLDFLRLSRSSLNHLFFRWFQLLASPREAEGIASSTWFVGGCFFAVLFPTDAAVAGILVLALSDPAASVAGYLWGRRPLGTGTVEGALVFGGLTFLILVALGLVGWGPALVIAAIVSVLECFPGPVDDNLLVPVAVAVLVWVPMGLLG